jgi:hypothetical protein
MIVGVAKDGHYMNLESASWAIGARRVLIDEDRRLGMPRIT